MDGCNPLLVWDEGFPIAIAGLTLHTRTLDLDLGWLFAGEAKLKSGTVRGLLLVIRTHIKALDC